MATGRAWRDRALRVKPMRCVAGGPATISELAEPFGISLTGMKKHVRLLEEAELVTNREGRADAPVHPRPAAARRR